MKYSIYESIFVRCHAAHLALRAAMHDNTPERVGSDITTVSDMQTFSSPVCAVWSVCRRSDDAVESVSLALQNTLRLIGDTRSIPESLNLYGDDCEATFKTFQLHVIERIVREAKSMLSLAERLDKAVFAALSMVLYLRTRGVEFKDEQRIVAYLDERRFSIVDVAGFRVLPFPLSEALVGSSRIFATCNTIAAKAYQEKIGEEVPDWMPSGIVHLVCSYMTYDNWFLNFF